MCAPLSTDVPVMLLNQPYWYILKKDGLHKSATLHKHSSQQDLNLVQILYCQTLEDLWEESQKDK